jgi:murein DD-endopeptidase MepM/ murein hydrolase activator NlpD
MKKNMMIAIFIGLMLAVVGSYANSIDDQINKNEKQLEDINNRLQEVDQNKNQNEVQQTEIEREVDNLEREIRDRNAKIKDLGIQVEDTAIAIGIKELELIEAEKEVSYQNDRMEKRLRTMYKSGNFGYLEVMLGSADFTDLLTRMDKIQLLLDYDQETLLALVEAREFVALKKTELEQKKSDLEAIKVEVELEKVKLQASVNLLEKRKVVLEQNHQALSNQLDQLNEDAEQVANIIKDLELRKIYVGGSMRWPLDINRTTISSPYGERIHPILLTKKLHTGIDVSAPKGSPVYAAQSGQVIYADWLGSYGMAVMIDHGGGIITLYGHNSALVATLGQEVKFGDVISKVGSTGRSTGNHLHFEVRVNGDYVDPFEYVTSP